MIQFKDITAIYDKKYGIFDLNFSVGKGEMIFLMGPTGAGKSTVFKTIYHDIDIVKGQMILDGNDVTKMKKRKIPYYRRKIGMIFQDYRLLTDRNVFHNIALPLWIEGVSNKDIKRRVQSIAEKVNLSNKIFHFPNNLSGGEKQRVSIARALIKQPKLILADEPTGNLDPNVSDDILDLLELATQEGTSVIMSTHDFHLIKPRRKQFIELNQGKLVK